MGWVCLDRPIPEFPLLTHAGHCNWETGRSYPFHRHLGFELLYVKRGAGDISVVPGKPPARCEADDLLITGPQVEHVFAIDRCDIEYYWLGIQSSPAIGLVDDHILPPRRLLSRKRSEVEFTPLLPEYRALATIIDDLEIGSFCRITRAAECLDPMMAVFEEAEDSRPNRAQAVLGHLLVLFSMIGRRVNGTTSAKTRSVGVAINYVRAHFAEPVTMESLAQGLNLHPSYLSRLFHRETGFTFREFLATERIARAKQLLKSGHSVGAVAGLTGYSSIQSFSRAFSRIAGINPSAYRGRSIRFFDTPTSLAGS